MAGRPERLVSGSDDFTMFMWEASTSKAPVARMTGHMQLINQASLCRVAEWREFVLSRASKPASPRRSPTCRGEGA